MSRLLALVALVFSLCTARAHHAPAETETALPARSPDAMEAPEGTSMVAPPLPEDWVTVREGPLEIAYPAALATLVAPTVASAAHSIEVVARPLGLTTLPTLQVRLVRDADEMRRLAPADAPPPAYATGVAYGSIGLALVAAIGPQHEAVGDMPRVLRHELSHLALAEATGHAAVPRWLSEGVAVEQSGEQSFERFETLARASFTHGIVPLDHLDAAFSLGPSHVDEAYAQSADFVAWLRRSDGGPRFAVMLGHIRGGESLEAAVRDTYDQPLRAIEEDWRKELSSRFALAPLWAGSGFVSVGAILLVGAAMIRRRRRSKTTLARWAREERLKAARRGLHVVSPGLRSHATGAHEDPPTLH